MRDLGDSGAPAVRPQAEVGSFTATRRSLLRGAAGAGAPGIAATALGGIAFPAAASAAASRTAAAGSQARQLSDADLAEPLVVHVRDAATGEIDVFRGTSQTRLHDRELAARLVRATR
jgi:hypothetical protein